MAVWILSGIKSRWCALTQMLIVAAMNTIEFLLVPELLLFGQGNAVMAALLITVIAINEFVLPVPQLTKAS